jgi:hypothetical protein
MGTANAFLGNTLLLMAILLFLAVLPRALRHILLQKENTRLDRVVGRFEKEELKVVAAQFLKNPPLSQKAEDPGGIPPFPEREDDDVIEVKVAKEGVPISHNEEADSSPPPRKKSKLIKEGFSIAPGENKLPSKKVSSDPQKSKTPAKDQKPTIDEDLYAPPFIEPKKEESEDSWIEAEIPGLTLEPNRATEKSDSIPTFKASPQEKQPPEVEKSQKSPNIEKTGMDVKNIARETEEKKNPDPKKQEKIETSSPELEIEFSESEPNSVKKKVAVDSHKSINKKKDQQEKAKRLPSKAIRETEAKGSVVSSQSGDISTSPEMAKPKPFLLDLKYLDREELEKENPFSQEQIPADMVDVVIARLNELQVDLEKQLISTPGELILNENPIDETSDQKDGLLEELDSFLFTANQRKKAE